MGEGLSCLHVKTTDHSPVNVNAWAHGDTNNIRSHRLHAGFHPTHTHSSLMTGSTALGRSSSVDGRIARIDSTVRLFLRYIYFLSCSFNFRVVNVFCRCMYDARSIA